MKKDGFFVVPHCVVVYVVYWPEAQSISHQREKMGMMNCGDIVREKATATTKPCVRVGEDDDQWERENLVHTQRAEWISYDKGWKIRLTESARQDGELEELEYDAKL